jgi:hypothetical protein
MKLFLMALLMVSFQKAIHQKDILCFVTSVRGDLRFDKEKVVKVGDTLSYSKVKNLQFYSPGLATFYCSLGSFRAYTSGTVVSKEENKFIDFVKDILKVNGKNISLSSRGNCTCMMAEQCLYSDPQINERLLLFDTLSFPAADPSTYDSCFYLLQMKAPDGRLFNNRLHKDGRTVIITPKDLLFNGKSNNDWDTQDVVLGVNKWVDGHQSANYVIKIKFSVVNNELLKGYFNTLKYAMPSASDAELYQIFYTDLYVFFGKPDGCRLKKLINYHD